MCRTRFSHGEARPPTGRSWRDVHGVEAAVKEGEETGRERKHPAKDVTLDGDAVMYTPRNASSKSNITPATSVCTTKKSKSTPSFSGTWCATRRREGRRESVPLRCASSMKLKSFQARLGTLLSSIVPTSLHSPKPWMCLCCHRNEKKQDSVERTVNFSTAAGFVVQQLPVFSKERGKLIISSYGSTTVSTPFCDVKCAAHTMSKVLAPTAPVWPSPPTQCQTRRS